MVKSAIGKDANLEFVKKLKIESKGERMENRILVSKVCKLRCRSLSLIVNDLGPKLRRFLCIWQFGVCFRTTFDQFEITS